MKSFLSISLLIICSILGSACYGQYILQLEKFRVTQGEKFYPGQKITFKDKAFPEDWRTETIERIIPSDSLIITEMGMIHINDFTHFRTFNEKVNAISVMLKTFAAAWFVYGGLAYLGADFDFGWDTAIVGGTAFVSGWLLKKLFYKNTYTLGKKHRLRILDISWPEPQPALRP